VKRRENAREIAVSRAVARSALRSMRPHIRVASAPCGAFVRGAARSTASRRVTLAWIDAAPPLSRAVVFLDDLIDRARGDVLDGAFSGRGTSVAARGLRAKTPFRTP
jgi:hypothetical protein